VSLASRTTLINSNLSNTIVYHMSMYLLPKTVADALDKQRRIFFGKVVIPRKNID
jgi:hypothetical protein